MLVQQLAVQELNQEHVLINVAALFHNHRAAQTQVVWGKFLIATDGADAPGVAVAAQCKEHAITPAAVPTPIQGAAV